MNLAVSNIAWSAVEEPEVASELAALGVTQVEVAPTKVFDQPTETEASEVLEYRRFWDDRGVSIVAFQSLLFGRPDLTIFDDAGVRGRTQDYLARFTELAGKLGARNLVFGSPKNRQVPKGMTTAEADGIAIDFFGQLGQSAIDNGTCVCIEPNPTAYGCNYIVTADAGLNLVRNVDNPGFRLHLDAAGMTLAGDEVGSSIVAAGEWLSHFHVSAPQLGEIEDSQVDHAAAAAALKSIAFTGNVSIEMRPGEPGEAVSRVRRAVELVRRFYGDV